MDAHNVNRDLCVVKWVWSGHKAQISNYTIILKEELACYGRGSHAQ